VKLQHNLGGLENLGPVSVETRPFVEAWEKRIFGIHVAMMALSQTLKDALPKYDIDAVPTAFKDDWTWGHLRTGAEGMNPFDYFKYRYFEKWLGGISSFFVAKGYVDGPALEARTAAYLNGKPLAKPNKPAPAIDAQVLRYLREGDSPKRVAAAPKFSVGDRVLVKDVRPVDHTRLPGYLCGKVGEVTQVYDGAYAYFFSTGPDDGIGAPMPVYCVKFEPKAIWGATAEGGATLYADLFEAYVLPEELAT
jgi:nitrile hydratase beta subunit